MEGTIIMLIFVTAPLNRRRGCCLVFRSLRLYFFYGILVMLYGQEKNRQLGKKDQVPKIRNKNLLKYNYYDILVSMKPH